MSSSNQIKEIPFKEWDFLSGENNITNAAVRVGDKVYIGWRHADIMSHLRTNNLCEHVSQDMQGFVDAKGNFFNRYQAQRIVWHTKQMPFGKKLAPELLSEHLWTNDGTPIVYEEKDEKPSMVPRYNNPY